MAGIPRPKSKLEWLVNEPWLYDIGIALCTAIIGVVGAKKFFDDHKPLYGLLVVGFIGANFLIAARKNWVLYKKKKADESIHDLEGCLHTLHAMLTARLGKSHPGKRLRITIHVPLENGHQLEQVLNYIGDNRKKNTVRRIFATQCGIIGVAFREKRPVVGDRINDDYESYIEELKTEWNYTEQDARALDPASKSWMAVPLIIKNEIYGVLYMDAIVPEFFNKQRQATAKTACVGIGRFVQERYLKD